MSKKTKDIKSSIISKDDIVFRVYNNIYHMLEYRQVDAGIKVYDTSIKLANAFKDTDPLIISGKHRTTGVTLKVFFFKNKDGLSKNKLSKIILSASKTENDILIVSPKPIKAAYDTAIREVELKREYSTKGVDGESIMGTDIYYMDYTKFYSVLPKYALVESVFELLSEKDALEFEELNKIIPEKCIINFDYDPMMLWIGAKPGNRVIQRVYSETGGLALRYIYVAAKKRHTKV